MTYITDITERKRSNVDPDPDIIECKRLQRASSHEMQMRDFFSFLVWLAVAGTKSALNVWALLANVYPDSYGVEPREAVDDG